ATAEALTIRLPDATWRARPPADRAVGLIADLEIETDEGGGARLIVRGREAIALGGSFVMPPSEGYPVRLVIDLVAGRPAPVRKAARKDAGPPAGARSESRPESRIEARAEPPAEPTLAAEARPAPESAPEPAVEEAPEPAVEKAASAAKREPAGLAPAAAAPAVPAGSRLTIVVDPGHGGFDPGATSLSGVPEKDITLAYAKELERQLAASGRFDVVLTRRTDRFVKLQERRRIAQEAGAQLFISLHADAHDDPLWQGASVYTLSRRASDDLAAALAAHVNAADLVAGPDLSGADEEVAAILLDLTRRETDHLSRRYAKTVVDELALATPLLTDPRRSASFVVLKMLDVPSILIELGFLSNPQDEAQLRDPDHRRRVAKAILRSLDRHFAQYQAAR
ncbi:MAG TPA: N-acetylmuramoyl-L-alanine amidase, partial [Kiloniellales bacterium]|nr:N-acetylmuramoyl-L-alanine amidase [Kiloniellales bacterium]